MKVGKPDIVTEALVKAGVIPENCTRYTLEFKPDDLVRVKMEVLLSEEQSKSLARVLEDNPAGLLNWAREQKLVTSAKPKWRIEFVENDSTGI